MERNEKVGNEIYRMLEESGPPYGCGTAGIVGGFAARLAIMSLTISDIDHDLHDVPGTFFLLSDEDNQEFQSFLDGEQERSINEVPLQLLECSYRLLIALSAYEDRIQDNVVVDYRMGMRMLNQVFLAAENILLSNGCSAEIRKDMLYYENKLSGTIPKSLQT
ncbi:hypothetical protein JI666_02265 [Bacillus sp. NTK071]|uniref:hypothetical protein n=1 Tax=Bacillus sp. NTK071 TaxID=2802175 RepID=UPI001A8F2B27|nr:hypothetical protein [Bacillus sp. NTK071]MBN8207570.1 hypothetical protein [Bacillus sp. NTK071]